MVHLESRNIDQENKRIEIGCKGRFACVKPFCFTRFFIKLFNPRQNRFLFPESVYLIGGGVVSVLQEEQLGFERQLTNEPLGSSFFVVVCMESQCGRGKSTARASGFYSSCVSIGQPFNFLAFRSLWPKSIQQLFIEANVRVLGGPTI